MHRFILYFLFLICLSAAMPAFAQPTGATRENFLTAWEENQRSQPTTKVFEKLGEPNTYNFETTIFPYKGKLKILNVLIHKDIEYYHNFDLNDAAAMKGLIEVELVDASEDFLEKHFQSINVWQKQNYLFFIADLDRWMTANQWQRHQHTIKIMSNDSAYAPESENKIFKILVSFMPAIIIFLLWFLFAKIQEKKYEKRCNISDNRQIEILDIAKESLRLQAEQNELIKKLLQK